MGFGICLISYFVLLAKSCMPCQMSLYKICHIKSSENEIMVIFLPHQVTYMELGGAHLKSLKIAIL